MLVACTSDDQQRSFSPGEADHSPALTGPFPSAETWIRALKQYGVSCKALQKYHPDTPFTYADAGACRLNGPRGPVVSDLVTVFFVKDPKQVIENHFARSNGFRDVFLYRDNWLADAPINAPKVIRTIRVSFEARSPDRNLEVPLVVGTMVKRAVRRIRAAGLVPKIVGPSPHGDNVTVVQQDPQPGTVIKAGQTVALLPGLPKNL